MKLMKVFFAILSKIKDAFQKRSGKVTDVMSVKSTGKLKILTPKQWRMFGAVALFLILFIMITLNFFSNDSKFTNGSENMKKEFTPTTGVGNDVSGEKFGDTLDPLEKFQLKKDVNDPLASLKEDGSGSGSGGSLSMTDCLDLTDKLKKNVTMSEGEKSSLQECLDKNIAQLSETDLNAMKKLSDPNISEEEKRLIRKQQNNELEAGSSAEKIAEALLDNNPKALPGVQAFKEKDQKAMDAVAKALAGVELSPEEQKLIRELAAKYAAENKAPTSSTADKDGKAIAGGSTDSNNVSGKSNEQIIKEMAEKIAAAEKQKEEVERQMKAAEAQAQAAAKKIAAGNARALTVAEQQAIAKIAELNKQLADIKKDQELKKEAYQKAHAELQKSLMTSSLVVQKSLPSGMSPEYLDEKGRKIVKKKPAVVKYANKDKYFDVDGQPLSPDKVRLYELVKTQKYQFDKLKKDINNPLGEQNFNNEAGGAVDSNNFGARLGQNLIAGGGEAQYQIAETKILTDKDLKKCDLTPNMKIPAVVDSEIIISSKDKNKLVRIKIIANIHCPQNNEIIIPKGSIGIAMATGGFDKETQMMDMTVSKISLGSGKTFEVNLAVGSADGSMGLKGKVYNTRTKYLAGAFITAFTSGALSWFGQQYVQPYQASTIASDALTGAALGGGSEVMQKLSEMYAGDLQNAPDIFWCPKKIPVILYPN